MRIAALYDIHGNLPALEAVLEDLGHSEVTQIIVGGDVVPGPMPREVMERLSDVAVPVQFIRGNCEREMLAIARGAPSTLLQPVREAMRWSARQLFPDYQPSLQKWPATLRCNIDGLGEILFCHGTPRDDNEIFTRKTPEDRLLPIFQNAGAEIVICGHTHMQFDRRIGSIRVINAGSVGMPFAAPGAHWLLLGSDIELRHTTYDLDKAAERIRATSYPQAAEFATNYVLNPPSEDAMINAFSKSELK